MHREQPHRQEVAAMTRDISGRIGIGLLLPIVGCGTPTPPEQRSAFDYFAPSEGGVECVVGGDYDEGIWNLDGCGTADGFFGRQFMTALEARPYVDPNLGDGPYTRYVYFVHEVRWLVGAAYRLATAVFFPGPDGNLIDVGTMAGHLLPGLAAVSFQGFVGACLPDAAYSDPEACAEFAFSQRIRHNEPVLCVWNPAVAAAASADSFCEVAPFSDVIEQHLPLAHFTGTIDGESCGSPSADPDGPPPPCLYSMSLDASASIPDRGIAEYRWSCVGDSTFVISTSPTVSLTCSAPSATLTVIDTSAYADDVTIELQ
jgi:hypothetical protein